MSEKIALTDLQSGRRPVRVRLWLSLALVVIVVGLAALAAAGAGLFRTQPYAFNGLPYEPPIPAPDFTLIDQYRQPVRLSDYRGKIVLLFFGFTHCPDACPTTLGTWLAVHRKLEAEAEQVRFVFITVDPERDTPERIKEHLDLFNPEFIGLRGSLAETEEVARAYNAFFEKVEVDSALDYLVNHTALTYVIDQDGQLVLAYPYNTGSQKITADLRYMLK